MPLAVTPALVAVLLSATPSSTPPPAPHPLNISATTAAAVAEWDQKVARLVRRGEMKVREERPSDDGRRVEQWLVQLHKGVPILGAEVWREIDDKKTVAIDGTIYDRFTMSATPRLTKAEARAVFIGLAKGSPGPSQDPQLAVLAQPDKFILVYQARVLTGTDLTLYSVDATTGDVVTSAPEPGPAQ